MAAIMISVAGINCENLSCNKRGVHIWVRGNKDKEKAYLIRPIQITLAKLR